MAGGIEEGGEQRDAGKANAIEKALKLLLEFLPDNRHMSTVELSKATGFHAATASRILLTLTEYGFLRQDRSTKRFSLGDSIVRLAGAVDHSLKSGVVPIAKPHMDSLSKSAGQTVTLETLAGTNTVLACVVEGPQVIRVAGQAGESLPWNVAVGLRSILAHMAPEERAPFFAKPMRTFTKNTVNTLEKYAAVLESVRKNGFSFEDSEFFEGVNALGAPIFGRDGKPLAAICLIGLATEVNDGKTALIEQLKKAAADVSREFFHTPD